MAIHMMPTIVDNNGNRIYFADDGGSLTISDDFGNEFYVNDDGLNEFRQALNLAVDNIQGVRAASQYGSK